MKQILPQLKELNKHLSFAKGAFTKGGFRHLTNYVDGLIALNKKTIKQISNASLDEKYHTAMNRILNDAKFEQELLEKRYLKKIKYLFKNLPVYLLLDDTLVERNGEKIEETQEHKDHVHNGFVNGHQFFTALLYTPVMQLPLFPQLYSKNTDSKIQMAKDTIDKVLSSIKIDTILFDSWYSDKKIIKKCMTQNVRVVCGIKMNRVISFENGAWINLSEFSSQLKIKKLKKYSIDSKNYRVYSSEVKLNGIPHIRMIVSHEYSRKKKSWNKIHLISTNREDTILDIICTYRIRWHIETYHRDIKQNLGFAKVFLRKKEGIVRHSIFVSLAYATLKLFMFLKGLKMSIGECCAYLQNRSMYDFLKEIIEIDDKQTRLSVFEEAFKRKINKL